ncbi:hypothetical protein Mapa_002212 [Marchantia paleacea]|nr:hypothetical protein Mapa_002212 [Marchantia paleacea]
MPIQYVSQSTIQVLCWYKIRMTMRKGNTIFTSAHEALAGVDSRTANLGFLIGGPLAVYSKSVFLNVTNLSQLSPSNIMPALPSVTL